jgi:hypothetical protein
MCVRLQASVAYVPRHLTFASIRTSLQADTSTYATMPTRRSNEASTDDDPRRCCDGGDMA